LRIPVFIGLFALVLSASAQGFWTKKDSRDWSRTECEQMLTNSPWARSRTIGHALIQRIGRRSAIEGRENAPEINYTVQLWSARPIRQALVRQVRMGRDFEKLSPEEKETLTEQHERILRADYPDRIIFKVLYVTNVQDYDRELARFWQMRPAREWQQDTFLVTSTRRIPPLEIRVAPGVGGEFQLIFPRLVNGEPLIGTNDKTFALEFYHPAIGVVRGERLFIEFKIKDMMLDEKFVY